MPEENSCNKLPRSGRLTLDCQLSLELGWRPIAQCRVQTFLVVDLFQELRDRSSGIGQIAVFIAQNLFILERFHERLDSGVIPRIAFATHADLDAVSLEQIRVVVAGILAAAI